MPGKQNNILPNEVFDFSIFPILEPESLQKRIIGSNHQKLMIVYAIESEPKEDLDFLKKIMSAVQIDLEKDLQLLGITALEQFSCSNLSSFDQLEKLIIFGKSPKELGIHLALSPYQTVQINGKTFLFADSLAKIAVDKGKKGQLWNCLKQVFQKN